MGAQSDYSEMKSTILLFLSPYFFPLAPQHFPLQHNPQFPSPPPASKTLPASPQVFPCSDPRCLTPPPPASSCAPPPTTAGSSPTTTTPSPPAWPTPAGSLQSVRKGEEAAQAAPQVLPPADSPARFRRRREVAPGGALATALDLRQTLTPAISPAVGIWCPAPALLVIGIETLATQPPSPAPARLQPEVPNSSAPLKAPLTQEALSAPPPVLQTW